MIREGAAAIGEMAADEARVLALDEIGQDRLALAGGGDANAARRRFRCDGIEPGGSAKGERQPLADGCSAALRRMEECDAPRRLPHAVDLGRHARAAHQLQIERPQHMLIP